MARPYTTWFDANETADTLREWLYTLEGHITQDAATVDRMIAASKQGATHYEPSGFGQSLRYYQATIRDAEEKCAALREELTRRGAQY